MKLRWNIQMNSDFQHNRQEKFLNLPEIKNLTLKEQDEINTHCNLLEGLESQLFSVDSQTNYSFLVPHYKFLQSILKNISAQNNLEKIVEADSILVGLASQLEEIRGASSAHAKNMAGFIKQADALSSVIDHCNYYKTYKDYEIVMKTHTKNVRSCEKYGLPEDAVFHNLNSNISALKKAKDENTGHPEYDNLTDIRIKALTRAKILYMQRQIPFMIEFAERYPDKSLARSFVINRANIENNVQSLLDKSDEVLGIQKDQVQTQTQTQQTQEQTSNKKAKSSPDIEL